MKIIFMGTPDFATYILDEIERAGHDIVLIVTQPDKPRGRSGKKAPSPVKSWAMEREIDVYQPAKIREESSIEYLRGIEADICVVAAFGQILPKEILDMPPYGCINVHASLLPKYRGAAPIQWSILNGDDKTGVTIMQMGVGLDDGDILYTEEVKLNGTETGGELFDTLAEVGGKACVKALSLIEGGSISPVPQDDSLATHVGMIDKKMGKIDWSDSADRIERYVRGLNPWPSCYTTYKNKTLKIWKSHVVPKAELHSISTGDYNVGQVCFVDKSNIYVLAGDGTVLGLDELQLEGKKRMDTKSFLLGNPVRLGEELN